MGFLFFTLLLLPAIILYGLVIVLIDWIRLNTGLVNAIVTGILVLNLLIIAVLARIRRRQKQAGPAGESYAAGYAAKAFLRKLVLHHWPVCAGFWALLCVVYLVVQPIRFIPKDWGTPPDIEDCYGIWEITGYRGTTSRSEEEIAPYIGVRIVYEEEQFTAGGQTYLLKYAREKSYDDYSTYQSKVIWKKDKVIIPGTTVTRQFSSLGIETGKVRRIRAWLQEDTDGEIVLGQLFYILDRDTILVYYGGVFFQAERVVQNPAENGA